MDVKRESYAVLVPRELLLDAGLVEPTPAERAHLDQQTAEADRRIEERSAKHESARRQLAAITDPLARAILDLHHEDDLHECAGYDYQGWEAEGPDWPCQTVRLVAEKYGIDLP
jgi:hypothetical protein